MTTRANRPIAPSEAFQAAVSLHQQSRLAEAERLYRAVLKAEPGHVGSLHHLGVVHAQQGRFEDAVSLIRQALRKNPRLAEAHNDLGVVLEAAKRHDEAVGAYEKALVLRPDYAAASFNLGNALQALKRHEDAIASFEQALTLQPDHAEAHNNLGNSLHALSRPEEAIERYEKALALRPRYAEAQYNLGNALKSLDRHDAAIAHYEQALAIRPDYAEAHNNLGAVLQEQSRYGESLAHYQKALALRPDYPEAHNNFGNALQAVNRHHEAIACYEKALALNPDYAEAYNNLGIALVALEFREQAVECYRRALSLWPDKAEVHDNLGIVFGELRQFEEAIACFRRAIELDPLHGHARSSYVQRRRQICDWSCFSEDKRSLIDAIKSRAKFVSPFVVVQSVDDPSLQLDCARLYVESLKLDRLPIVWDGGFYAHSKIRIGYLSSNFRQHPTSILIAELFENHDREGFEIFALSWRPGDGSEMRRRVERSVDRFMDVSNVSDLELSRKMRALEIDIAVDLKGLQQHNRLPVFAHRSAPIQVNYLASPVTSGAEFMDYIIADPFIAPFDQEPYFAEKVVQLPDCYQANDSKRQIAERTPSRAECELPDQGFVFACFNNAYKITPRFFDIWMRLLQAIPGSVLWMLDENSIASANLRKEAEARGVSAERLVFAARMPLPEHLARHRLADLFLDTLPYNAHTTASDTLWAGLPMVTCAGHSFASRVGGSLLRAVGLPELVTDSLEDYEALALKLARDPGLLEGVRGRLAKNRLTAPLFDSDRFRRHIEYAYQEMWARWQRGEPPCSFTVPAISS